MAGGQGLRSPGAPAGPGTGQEATPLWALLLGQMAPSPSGSHSWGLRALPGAWGPKGTCPRHGHQDSVD